MIDSINAHASTSIGFMAKQGSFVDKNIPSLKHNKNVTTKLDLLFSGWPHVA